MPEKVQAVASSYLKRTEIVRRSPDEMISDSSAEER